MSNPCNTNIIYEQPLNERIRTFLRLEYLFERASHALERQDTWSSRFTLETVIDLLSLMSRADIKMEFIQELDRHASTLETLEKDPRVDTARLAEILDRVRTLLHVLRTSESTPGNELRKEELLSIVRQRHSIPAGTCDFDLPAFHFWLHSPIEQRAKDLSQWLSAFDIIRETVVLCLKLVRESATATNKIAAKGFFQQNLNGTPPCQLVRVALPADTSLFPEISAGSRRFTIRFMEQSRDRTKPAQTTEDVKFDLLCCII